MRTAAPVDIGSATMRCLAKPLAERLRQRHEIAAGAEDQDLDVVRLGEDPGEAPLVDDRAGASQP